MRIFFLTVAFVAGLFAPWFVIIVLNAWDRWAHPGNYR